MVGSIYTDSVSRKKQLLGGNLHIFGSCTPDPWGNDSNFDGRRSSNGFVQPPTRLYTLNHTKFLPLLLGIWPLFWRVKVPSKKSGRPLGSMGFYFSYLLTYLLGKCMIPKRVEMKKLLYVWGTDFEPAKAERVVFTMRTA